MEKTGKVKWVPLCWPFAISHKNKTARPLTQLRCCQLLVYVTVQYQHFVKAFKQISETSKTMDKEGNNSGTKGRRRSEVPRSSRMTDLSAALIKYSL